jgi:signal recognition particle subunit SRP54
VPKINTIPRIEFKEALKISGIIITRMDSSAKAGGAITACNQTQSPIYFLTTGEKINDLEEFEPESFLSRILGMGDLKTLVEKVKSITNEDEQKEMQERLQQGKISIEDVISQVKTMNTLGGFDKIKSLIPGFSSAKIPEEKMQEQQKKIQKWEHIVKSMTKEEKANPEILEKENSRVNRIAKGAGVNNSDVKSLIKQYRMLADMIKTSSTMNMEQGFSQKDLQKLMKKFGKRKVIRF